MNPAEAVALTGYLQAYFPQQPVNEYTPDALSELLEPYTLTDCQAAVRSLAMRLHGSEGQRWCAPTDLYAEVRRARAKAITSDEPIHMPPGLDPDDTAAYIECLAEGRKALAEGRPIPEPTGLTARPMRELLARVTKTQIKPMAEPTPDPPAVFACEQMVGDSRCAKPAPHMSADRRRPLCDDHREPAPEPEPLTTDADRLREPTRREVAASTKETA